MLVNGKHIFEGQRLEVQAVAGVVIGRDRLRIAVDHDGFVAVFAQRERGMAAAVIKLNSLPNTVGPAAQNHDFFFGGRRGFVFLFVGRIEVRGIAFELGSAGVHALVHRLHAEFLAQMPDFFLSVQPPRPRQPPVGETLAFGLTHHLDRHRFHRVLFGLQLHVVDFFELVQEPGIN